MIKDFLAKISPFGKRESLEVPIKTQEKIHALIVEQPELWEALKEVAYMMMNQKTRAAIVNNKKDTTYIDEILAIDDFLKVCLTIKEKKRNIEVEINGHLPVMPGKGPQKRAGGGNTLHYLASKDLKGGKVEAKKTAH